MDRIIQITVRGFYTCKFGSVSPEITLTVTNPKEALDISKVVAEIDDMIKAAPGPELRPMTEEEIAVYLAEKEDNQ